MILYITDLDGTLLNSSREISPYSRHIIEKLAKSQRSFTVASARTVASAVKILAGSTIRVPAVLMNGVVVYDIAEKKYVDIKYIDWEITRAVTGILHEIDINGFMYVFDGKDIAVFYEDLKDPAHKNFYDERMAKYYRNFIKTDDLLDAASKNNKVIYFTLMDIKENLIPVFKLLEGIEGIGLLFYKDVYEKELWFLEIFNEKASKYNAVAFLKKTYGFKKIIGFGDNLNDISLFKACDECYAVSNAVDELKMIADGIIGDNDSDGVALFIAQREGLL